MAAPKVVALYRTDRGRFALDEAGNLAAVDKSTSSSDANPTRPSLIYADC